MLASSYITPRLGSELDPTCQLNHLSEAQVTALVTLCAERGVVVARNQRMSPQEQAEFAHRLGEPLTFPNNPAHIPEELIVIQAGPNSKQAAGEGWHSDVSSEMKPPGLSMLRMEQVPDHGGDTLFADMYQAFESLSPPIQAFLQTLTARHEPRGHYLYLSGAKAFEELDSSDHPIVRIHPLTDKKALYVNDGFVSKINGISQSESRALLKMLYDHIAYTVKMHCRIAWAPDTVVFWDNRCVQHYAAFDYFPERRKGYRATIRGEQPIACH